VRLWLVVMLVVGCRGGEIRQVPKPMPSADAVATSVPVPVPATVPDAAPAPGPDAPPPKPDDWVDVAAAIPSAVLDMRYASADNFTKQVVYPVARCLLRRSVADRLARAAATLAQQQRRLLLWDCYRPAAIQKLFWELVPDPRYVAKPVYGKDGRVVSGSRHSRGAAIDVGLVDADGKPVTLPTAHDDFSRAAHRKQAKKSAGAAELAILDAALTAEGFRGMPTEWWHYDAPDAGNFPFADVPLDIATP
jgi:zinc D-Ala-D-Ala dipeptidase